MIKFILKLLKRRTKLPEPKPLVYASNPSPGSWVCDEFQRESRLKTPVVENADCVAWKFRQDDTDIRLPAPDTRRLRVERRSHRVETVVARVPKEDPQCQCDICKAAREHRLININRVF